MKKLILFSCFLFLYATTYQVYSQSITWSETQPAGNFNMNWHTTSMSSDGSKMIAGVYNGRLYVSTNSGSSWAETQPSGNSDISWETTSMSSDGSKLIAGVYSGRLYISTNGGNSWAETTGFFNKAWETTSMSSDGSKLIAGVYDGRLYISTNGGSSWSETQPAGAANKGWRTTSMSSDGSKMIAGVYDGRLYISINGGSNWAQTQPAGDANKGWQTTSMSSDGSKMIAGIYGGRLYISINGGSSWSETQPLGDAADKDWVTTSMSSDGSKMIAGVHNGRLYVSTNSGSSWSETQPAGDVNKNWLTTSMSSDANKLIAGVSGSRLYLNNEPLPVELTSFTANIVDGKVTLSWNTATEVNNYGFEVERAKGSRQEATVWERIAFVQGHGNSNSPKGYSFTDDLTLARDLNLNRISYRLKQIDFDGKYEYSNVVEVNVDAPTKSELAQNYPNPFNPTTAISYQLSAVSHVTLKVYDVLGREITTLVNGQQNAGLYNVVFDGGKYSSGVYFYRIDAVGNDNRNFTSIKKLVLMK